MRLYPSVTKPRKTCSHGIAMNKHCLKCLDYEIESKKTDIKLLKTMRNMVVKILDKEKKKK